MRVVTAETRTRFARAAIIVSALLAVAWEVTPNDCLWYFGAITITGPIGVPLKWPGDTQEER